MNTPTTKLISAEEWTERAGYSTLPSDKEQFEEEVEHRLQIQINALEWAAEQIGNDAIFQQRPADFGLLLQRKQLILSQIAELKKGQS